MILHPKTIEKPILVLFLGKRHLLRYKFRKECILRIHFVGKPQIDNHKNGVYPSHTL